MTSPPTRRAGKIIFIEIEIKSLSVDAVQKLFQHCFQNHPFSQKEQTIAREIKKHDSTKNNSRKILVIGNYLKTPFCVSYTNVLYKLFRTNL